MFDCLNYLGWPRLSTTLRDTVVQMWRTATKVRFWHTAVVWYCVLCTNKHDKLMDTFIQLLSNAKIITFIYRHSKLGWYGQLCHKVLTATITACSHSILGWYDQPYLVSFPDHFSIFICGGRKRVWWISIGSFVLQTPRMCELLIDVDNYRGLFHKVSMMIVTRTSSNS